MRPRCEASQDQPVLERTGIGEENLGLRTVEELRSFCAELAEAASSPGGGSAAAAAGAVGASLLAMVCGITARSRKHACDKTRLDELRDLSLLLQGDLIRNARLDAEAYDRVIEASRKRKESPGEATDEMFEEAVKHAAEVPLRTAELCAKVLEAAVKVSELGSKSAASDSGTAVLMAQAGFKGAAMNVYINLGSLKNAVSVKTLSDRIERLSEDAGRSAEEALARLELLPRK